MLGFTKAHAAGKIAHEMLRTEFPQPFAEIKAELMQMGHWEGDLIKTAQDGRRVVVVGRWALQKGKRGEPTRILVVNSDITERKRARRNARLAMRTTSGAG
jgi:PAS domain-containing protein